MGKFFSPSSRLADLIALLAVVVADDIGWHGRSKTVIVKRERRTKKMVGEGEREGEGSGDGRLLALIASVYGVTLRELSRVGTRGDVPKKAEPANERGGDWGMRKGRKVTVGNGGWRNSSNGLLMGSNYRPEGIFERDRRYLCPMLIGLGREIITVLARRSGV